VSLTNFERKKRFALLFGYSPGVNKVRVWVENLVGLIVIFGGLLISLKALEKYAPVDDNTLLYIFPSLIVVALLIFSNFEYFKSLGSVRLTGGILILVLVCEALIVGYVCGGLFLLVNGALDQTQKIRRVSWADKHVLISHGKKPQYMVDIQSWQDPNHTLRLTVPETVYRQLQPDTKLQLTLGEGVLHVEWIRSISISGHD
jgi:hypothetical protein